jgi:hypothetical protein
MLHFDNVPTALINTAWASTVLTSTVQGGTAR